MSKFWKRENLLLVAIQACVLCCFCCYTGFLVKYLQLNGYNDFLCGLAVTISSIVTLVTQPFVGYITDTYLSCKKFLMLIMALAIPAACLLPLTVHNVPLTMLSVALFSLTFNSNTAVVDAWSVQLRDMLPHINYEVTRSVGSFIYSFFALFFGGWVDLFGTGVMFIGFGVLAVLLILFCIPLKEIPCENRRRGTGQGERLSMLAAGKQLIHIRPYVIFIVSALCYNFAVRSTSSFLSNYAARVQEGSTLFGVLLFVSGIVELPCIFLLKWVIRRSRLETAYLLACCGMIAKSIFLYFSRNFICLLAAMVMHGLAYIGFVTISVNYIKAHTPRRINSTAISLGMALTAALGNITGAFFGGFIVDRLGIDALSITCLILGIAALVVFLPNLKVKEPAQEDVLTA